MVESNYTTILSPAYVYIYMFIYIYIIYTIQLYSWFYIHFPASDFLFPSRCFAPGIPGIRGLRFSQEDVLRLPQRSGAEGRILAEMAHLCGGFTMIYRTFWLLKMVMFHIFSRAIGSSKIRESPIEMRTI